ncbi:hypothetical protein K7X08_031041 [Anisodus acutangulus]|uniref:Uncharacterized protein n=1 Tax=Anisodus acutangulus TaxID=402998 RepID=A0A9Q1MPC8_9SOLA|nr:hypothetical protein K7X08_031041 [Anisodus acutangulus]
MKKAAATSLGRTVREKAADVSDFVFNVALKWLRIELNDFGSGFGFSDRIGYFFAVSFVLFGFAGSFFCWCWTSDWA